MYVLKTFSILSNNEVDRVSCRSNTLPLLGVVSYFYLLMEVEEKDFVEKISEFYHDNMCAWIDSVLDLYGNVISKINNPVTQIHMDDWRVIVTKQYADLSEGEKEFYRAKARWLWYKHFKTT